MKYYTATYLMPVAGLDEWMSKAEEERKGAEDEMKGKWDAWLESHKDHIKNTIALGKTKRVSSDGVVDAKNGAMLSSYVAAESLEEAADLFKDHPHLTLPGATIEVMETNQM